MMRSRVFRTIKAVAGGAILLQAGGCDLTGVFDFAQTVFLGITAAGSIAIIQNL